MDASQCVWFRLGTINNSKAFSYFTVRTFNELKGTCLNFNIGKFFLKYSTFGMKAFYFFAINSI